VLWGSAFLFTKLAVESIPPQLVVVGRLAIATVILIPLAVFMVQRPEGGVRFWLFMVLIALFGSALPFSLITWGQQYIDSGLSGILMAIMPIATLSLAHFLVPGERLTPYRVTGFVLGFIGVVVIMGTESLLSSIVGGKQILPILAVLGGAFCFAVAAILARLRPPSDGVSGAAATTLIATVMVTPFALGPGQALLQGASASSIVSLAVLGVFSTALGGVLYFRLVKTAGPAFVSQLNYFIPLWAVLAGMVFLNEHPQARHLLALVLILGGVLVSQFEYRRPRADHEAREEARSTA
jgi:drug/metabolite transporter (DMT)-like permease